MTNFDYRLDPPQDDMHLVDYVDDLEGQALLAALEDCGLCLDDYTSMEDAKADLLGSLRDREPIDYDDVDRQLDERSE